MNNQQGWGRVKHSAPPHPIQNPLQRPPWQLSRLLRIGITLLALLLFGRASAAPVERPITQPDEGNRAGLVVVHGDGNVVTRCVAFEEPEISGYELLQASGLDLGVEASGMGASICRIDGEGCSPPGQSCFCHCMSSPCIYWSYWRMNGAEWSYSNLGAANTTVQPGDVEGWAWSQGIIGSGADNQPPRYTFDQICAPPTPTPTLAPVATATGTPTALPTSAATFTVTPTETPTATPTTMPVEIPTQAPTTGAPATPTFTPMPTSTPFWTSTPAVTPLPVQPDESEINAPPEIRVFTVERTEINFGEATTLVWVADGAERVLLRYPGGEERVESSGSHTVEPKQTGTYTLVAQNRLGEAAQMLQIQVNPIFTTPTSQATSTSTLTSTPAPALEPTIEPTLAPVVATSIETRAEAAALPTSDPGITLLPITGTAPTTEQADEPRPQVAQATTEAVTAEASRPEDSPHTEAITEATAAAITETTAVALIPPAVTSTPVPEPEMAERVPAATSAVTSAVAQDETLLIMAPEIPPASTRMRLLALLGGGVLVLGAPLLFAFIWVVVWSVWRKT